MSSMDTACSESMLAICVRRPEAAKYKGSSTIDTKSSIDDARSSAVRLWLWFRRGKKGGGGKPWG